MLGSFFYCTHFKYEIGHILTPGPWASFVNSIDRNSKGVQLEKAFESVRQQFYKDKIGRLECLYAFTRLSDAEGLLMKQNDSHLYTLKPLVPETSLHNYSIIDHLLRISNDNTIHTVLEAHEVLIHHYWEGEEESWVGFALPYAEEIHIGGAAEVIARKLCQ